MRKTSLWIGLFGTVGYCIMLAVLLFFAYLVLVLSVPGVGDTQKWARSVNYICSGGLVYATVSSLTVLIFALAKRFYHGMVAGLFLGILCAVGSAYLSAPLFALG